MNMGLFEMPKAAIARWVDKVIRIPGQTQRNAVVLEIPVAAGTAGDQKASLASSYPMSAGVTDVVIQMPKIKHIYSSVNPILTGAFCLDVTDGTTIGGNKRGVNSVDLQTLRNSSPQVANGARAVISGGAYNTASGIYSNVTGGGGSTASGSFSCVTGGTANIVDGSYSRAGGINSYVNAVQGRDCFASGGSSTGWQQVSQHITRNSTTDATATVLTASAAAATSALILAMRNASTYCVRYMVVARQATTGDSKCWEGVFAVKRGANAASTAILGTPTKNVVGADAGASAWDISIIADTTNGGPVCQVTGEAAKTISWDCHFQSLELVA